ncbi:hypothetical protein HY407_05355 [Candidatus Gottesmanbacteria bacterium]|nr:hypothetical protein [Candidatus Gottesmanbacteria bacterium]
MKVEIEPPSTNGEIAIPPAALPPGIETLGVWAERPRFIDYLKRYNRFIFVAPPGMGKSIGGPPMAMDAYDQGIVKKPIMPERSKVSIVETQPRKAAAGNVAKGIAHFIGSKVGELVGLRYKRTNLVSDKTRILVEVEGSLMNALKNDPMLRDFDVVIPDEIHEVGANLIVTLALLKRADDLRADSKLPPLTIIPTSGTPNAAAYADYFKRNSKGQQLAIDVPILSLEREQEKDIEYHWWPGQRNPEYEQLPIIAANVLAEEIVGPKKSGDVLIVTPGQSEQATTIKAIKEAFARNKFNLDEIQIIPFDRSTPTYKREQQIENIEDPTKRRVIVATSIANTSVTIKRLENVINMGWQKLPNIDHQTGLIDHDPLLSSQSTNTQIENRAGRGEGEAARVWHLFTQSSSKERPQHDVSGIKRTDLAAIMLSLKDQKIDIRDIDLLESPDAGQIQRALTTLKILEAVKDDGEISDIGIEMAKLQIDPHLSRMVVEAKKENVLEAATVIALMKENFRDLFYGNRDEVQAIIKAHQAQGSDFLTLINIWNAYQKVKSSSATTPAQLTKWLEGMHLNPETLENIESDAKDINNDQEIGEIVLTSDAKRGLKRCLMVGFADRLFERSHGDVYIWSADTEMHGIVLGNRSAVYNIKPKHIISAEMNLAKKSKRVYLTFNEDVSEETDIIDEVKRKIESVLGPRPTVETPPEVTTTTQVVLPPDNSPRQEAIAESEIKSAAAEVPPPSAKPQENIIKRIYNKVKHALSYLNPLKLLAAIKRFIFGK